MFWRTPRPYWRFALNTVRRLDARRRAWAAVGTRLAESGVSAAGMVGGERGTRQRMAASVQTPRSDDIPVLDHATAPRFVLWVDGVGGYLVCQGDTISLGQPVQGSYVDVPVLADISRSHATIRRDGESYLIEPLRKTRVDGRVIDKATSLSDGSEIELGDGVRLRFRVPSPLSRTARLDFVSRHRTLPTTDGVLLLAESCILGPSTASHVVCRDWSREVILFLQGDKLYCRAAGRYLVDGVECDTNAPITRSSQIVGEDFSLSLEKA